MKRTAKKRIVAFMILLLVGFERLFAFDCQFQELWMLIIRAECIVKGVIKSTDEDSYVFQIEDFIAGRSLDEPRIVIKKGVEPDDTIQSFVPVRYKNYENGEELLLFLTKDNRLNMYRNMGCYFEDELIVFEDSLSFSKLRSDDNPYCKNCKTYQIDSLHSAIIEIRKSYSFADGTGYYKIDGQNIEEEKFGCVTKRLFRNIAKYEKQQDEWEKDDKERKRKRNFIAAIPTIISMIMVSIILTLQR